MRATPSRLKWLKGPPANAIEPVTVERAVRPSAAGRARSEWMRGREAAVELRRRDVFGGDAGQGERPLAAHDRARMAVQPSLLRQHHDVSATAAAASGKIHRALVAGRAAAPCAAEQTRMATPWFTFHWLQWRLVYGNASMAFFAVGVADRPRRSSARAARRAGSPRRPR